MRRTLPLLATGLLALGAAAGAVAGAEGVPGRSPSTWVTGVLDATRAAGTAHVSIRVASSDGSLHVVEHVAGAVDFAAGTYRLSYRTGSSAAAPGSSYLLLGAGHHVYVELSVPGQLGPAVSASPTWELLRVDATVDEAVTLLPRPADVWQVHDLGPSELAGRATMHYRLTVVARPVCSDEVTETAQVWVDAHGRIARSTITTRVSAPGARSARDTTVTTLTLSEFGAPVVVAPPSAGTVVRPSGEGLVRSQSHCSP